MRTTAILATALSALSLASARIYGFAAPTTVARDADVKLEIIGADYIQSIQDVAISFGYQAPSHIAAGTLGSLLSSKYLGPDDSNVIGNITHYVHIPATAPEGHTTITGSLFSLIGARLSPSIDNFQVNVTVGKFTSSEYVESS